MATITQKGRQLADKLEQGCTQQILENCSLLCRAATSYARIQEARCNGHPAMGNPRIPAKEAGHMQADFDAWLDKREAQLLSRIEQLAGRLPGVCAIKLSGDPRGATVKLAMQDGRTDDWGQQGLCVPGS